MPKKPLGFFHGLLLQILNPKLMIYALTLFVSFLYFALAGFVILIGTTLKGFLHLPRLRLVINIILALSLLYAALGLLELV